MSIHFNLEILYFTQMYKGKLFIIIDVYYENNNNINKPTNKNIKVDVCGNNPNEKMQKKNNCCVKDKSNIQTLNY